MLGYNTFSEYCLKTLCAENPSNVEAFLNKLKEKMRVLQTKEMEVLLEYKRKEVILRYINFNDQSFYYSIVLN